MRKFLIGIAVAASLLGAFSIYMNLPAYRCRLSIQIDTPEGPKMGTGVFAVHQIHIRWGLPETKGVRSRVRGEAIFIELGKGHHVVALLALGRWGEDKYRMSSLPLLAFLAAGRKIEWFDVKNQKGSVPLKGDLIPTLVTFADVNDARSARVVPPDQFGSVFGPGYRFAGATIEITKDPITTGIKNKLPFLNRPFPWTKKSTTGYFIDTRPVMHGSYRLEYGQFKRKR